MRYDHLTFIQRDQSVHGKRTNYFHGIQFNKINSLGNLVVALSLQLLYILLELAIACSDYGNNNIDKVPNDMSVIARQSSSNLVYGVLHQRTCQYTVCSVASGHKKNILNYKNRASARPSMQALCVLRYI